MLSLPRLTESQPTDDYIPGEEEEEDEEEVCGDELWGGAALTNLLYSVSSDEAGHGGVSAALPCFMTDHPFLCSPLSSIVFESSFDGSEGEEQSGHLVPPKALLLHSVSHVCLITTTVGHGG